MKIKLNKKLVATIVAGGIAFSLTGCGSDKVSDTTIVDNNVDFTYEDEIDLDYNDYKEDQYVTLTLANLDGETRITLNDGTNTPLNTFDMINEDSYLIPGKKFTVSFDALNSTYSYPIDSSYGAHIFISKEVNNNSVCFNIEKSETASMDSLEECLTESNINLDSLSNESDCSANLVRSTNLQYRDYDLVYQRDAFYLNEALLYEKVTDENGVRYFSSLRRGDGENSIDVLDDETVKITFVNSYCDNYEVVEKIENNVNYFFNNIHESEEENYISDTTPICNLVNKNAVIKEYIVQYINGESVCYRYSYETNGNELIEFGQKNYNNDYYLKDEFGIVNDKIIDNQKTY